MTRQQEQILNRLRRDIMENDGLGKEHMDNYEYKRWEVTPAPECGLVFLVTEVGLKGDEGTMAEVFARTFRHIVIGPRGGVQSLPVKARGYQNVLIHGYER